MPSYRLPPLAAAPALVLAGALALAGCGTKGTGASDTVKMKDMEVVDGTTNDGMTDLDGVQSEAIAVADTGGNASASAANGSAPAAVRSDAAIGNSAEAVPEQ